MPLNNAREKKIQWLPIAIADKSVQDQFENIVNQVEHRDNVLVKKGGRSGTINLENVTKIIVVNGQIRGWE